MLYWRSYKSPPQNARGACTMIYWDDPSFTLVRALRFLPGLPVYQLLGTSSPRAWISSCLSLSSASRVASVRLTTQTLSTKMTQWANFTPIVNARHVTAARYVTFSSGRSLEISTRLSNRLRLVTFVIPVTAVARPYLVWGAPLCRALYEEYEVLTNWISV